MRCLLAHTLLAAQHQQGCTAHVAHVRWLTPYYLSLPLVACTGQDCGAGPGLGSRGLVLCLLHNINRAVRHMCDG